MSKVLLVGKSNAVRNALKRNPQKGDLEVERMSWQKWLPSMPLTGQDAYLLDFADPAAPSAAIIDQVQSANSKARILMVVDKPSSIDPGLFGQNVDFVNKSALAQELPIRLAKLMNRSRAATRKPLLSSPRSFPLRPTHKKANRSAFGYQELIAERSAFSHLVPNLHDPISGRLDAKRVSELFGVPLAEVAQAVGRAYTTVHKTPASPSLQPRLALLEKIAASLLRLLNGPTGLRIWLNTPNPELEDETPWGVIVRGEGDVVEGLLEDELLGQPG